MAETSPEADEMLARALVSAGRLRSDQLEECRERQRALGGGVSLARILVERGILHESEIEPTLLPRPADPDAPVESFSQANTAVSHLPSPRSAPELPPRIGRYDVEAELGRGGMGVVYRAVDAALGRRVAIKMVLDPARAGEAELQRFQREARAVGALRHPGIVSVFETGEHEGKPYLVMELVPGESFEALLRKGELAPRRVAEIVQKVALALAHAHEKGIVHRDVKPENVLVDSQGAPHLVDFGLARSDGAEARLTKTGDVLGTPSYMAPEQASGDLAKQGPGTDVYALGAVLYRALTGRPPFEAPSLEALLFRILFDEPVPPTKKNPSVHPDLETIALRCMAKEPERRIPSAAEVAAELGRFLENLPIHARPISRLERARMWARRNSRLALVGALATIAICAVASTAFVKLAGERERAREAEALARRALQLAPTDQGAAIEAASSAIALEPNLALAWSARGVARSKGKDVEGAVADLTRAIDLDPGDPLPWRERGTLFELSRVHHKAEDDLARAVELAPKDAAAWMALGAVHMSQGLLDAAISDETRALAIDPRLAEAWANRGAALAGKGIADRALADLTRAIEVDPRVEAAWRNRGIVRLRLGDLAGAMADCSRAIELEPTDGRAFVNRALARGNASDEDGALADLTRATDVEPGLAEAWRFRGLAWERRGEHGNAVSDLTRAIDLDPRDLHSWEVRGAARLSMDDADGAISDLTRAIEIDPSPPMLWRNRGLARKRKGDRAGAASDLERFVQLAPNDSEADSLRATISELRK